MQVIYLCEKESEEFMGKVRMHMIFTGRVKGVGFRYRASYAAKGLGVTGWVKNQQDGTVEMEAQGSEAQIQKMLKMLQTDSFIAIHKIESEELPLKEQEQGFRVKGY